MRKQNKSVFLLSYYKQNQIFGQYLQPTGFVSQCHWWFRSNSSGPHHKFSFYTKYIMY